MQKSKEYNPEFHGDLTRRDFWLEWFGLHGGRELGSNVFHEFGTCPKGHDKATRMFTDNPEVYLEFIDWCTINRTACWITTQPMRAYNTPLGIEKLFFDFDYPLGEGEEMTSRKKTKARDKALSFIAKLNAEPICLETYKGYHVYVFLRRIYMFEPRHFNFAKEIFGVLGLSLLGINKVYAELTKEDRKKWKREFLDFTSIGDIMRFSRVPLSLHEKSGLPCKVLNRRLEETKIRSVDFYRTYGLKEDAINSAVSIVEEYNKRKLAKQLVKVNEGVETFKQNGNGYNNFSGQMRPCFTERLKIGEMDHQQRLALLLEMWWSGHKTPEAMLEICKQFKDYDERKSMAAINDFFNHERWTYPPYRCDTLEAHGFCLQSECPIYLRRKNKRGN